MKRLEEMTIFELKEYREILIMLKNKYSKEFTYANEIYDYISMFEEVKISDFQCENSEKFNFIQSEIEKIDKLIENIIFNNYDKKDK
jgi:hypothetical protein